MKAICVGTAAVAAALLLSLPAHCRNCAPVAGQISDGGPDPVRVEGNSVLLVMALLGVDSPEDLDEDEVEAVSAYLQSPLEINSASPSRLVSSGLFTPYRSASLLDYRKRHGDVLSLTELSAVDGFSEEFVRVLAPFISLRSSAPAGTATQKNADIRNLLTARASVRDVGTETQYGYGVKYRMDVGGRFQVGISANNSYSSDGWRPDGGSFYLAYYGSGRLGKLVLGDYRLRFGQGLALWSGFTMESLTSPEAYCLRSSGISPYWSFTGNGSYRGVAADFSIGRFTVSSSVAMNGLRELMDGSKDVDLSLMPAVNVAWHGRKVSVALTGYCVAEMQDLESGPFSSAVCSADFRWCPRGTDVFGEVAADLLTMELRAVAGAIIRLSDPLSLAVKAAYDKDEYRLSTCTRLYGGDYVRLGGKSGFGSSVRRHNVSLGAELSWFPGRKYGADGPNYQFKGMANYSVQLTSTVSMTMRYSLRLRSAGEKCRNDLRCDLKYANGPWTAVLRLNALYNTSLGLLSYVEGGWNSKIVSAYLRAGIFRIDNWADRIYVYERDAPGNFNVPAYYGRGCWAAFTLGAKLAKSCKVYLRASTLQYPWVSPTASTRTPKTEGKLMITLDI